MKMVKWATYNDGPDIILFGNAQNSNIAVALYSSEKINTVAAK